MSGLTPETNAAKLNHSYGVVDIDFARKLERERDEAREQAQRLRVQLNHYSQANEMAEQAFRERDEARNQRDILRLDAQKEAEHHDRMIGELERIYAERDEAREMLQQYMFDRSGTWIDFLSADKPTP